ncbi:phosphoenolpyruvate synthase [Hypericibacter adhaerens]|jgi:pyruvate,water dikinase|uniref:Phosphoenolpyruvate synthase n=1 Tax=Hypericibacter adhaerens TaxID=2602016 RepID=A0A5J6N6U5_9PROT|nr:PEP/pyruvate-binding domain-containing protein [Hypericibacter adhaerens]QEX24695.1 phosphoenolpyruvate synthase [Hypericibacter adhaerens]
MNGIPFILWLDHETAPGNPILGGKFSSLAEMTAGGFAVPSGFGITTAAYRRFMDHAGLVNEARRVRETAPKLALSQIKNETATLLGAIASAPLPPDLEGEVRENYALLEQRTGMASVPVAVRSSGESEDLAGASFAGQYDTYLWICGADSLLRHMRSCWASMFGEAVLSYRQDGNAVVTTRDFGICVGIQQMVPARAAGVMFTLDPINGDRSKIVLEACWGLGEGVVKGDITPTQFTIDKVTFEIVKRKPALQTQEYRFDPEAGAVGLTAIEPERQEAVCIADKHVLELAALAKRIEQRRGAPQDIEWAVSERDEVKILQVRPETVWSRRAAPGLVTAAKSPVEHVLARLSGVRTMGGTR